MDDTAWSLVFMDESSMTAREKSIYEFLTNFFLYWRAGKESSWCLKTCRRIISKKEMSAINIQSLQLTEQSFDSTYQGICEEVFRYKYKKEYVISLLAFSIELDRHLEKESWYTTDRLVSTLTNQLGKTEFEPSTMKDDSECHWSSFLINLPALFLAHFLQK